MTTKLVNRDRLRMFVTQILNVFTKRCCLSLLLAWPAAVLAESAGHVIDSQALSRSVQASIDKPLCCEFDFASAIGSDQNGTFSIDPMYASERGSWPFEPFANNGLFSVIAGYQQHHPRALSLTEGHYTLSELAKAVNNETILRAHKDGFLLSYPLQILPGASLSVENTTLYLAAYSGTALINRGDFQLNSSRLTVWQGDRAPSSVPNYRPFLVAWAGSRTWLLDSHLDRLGYNANLSRGVTVTRSKDQSTADAAPQLLVRSSRFSDMTSAIDLNGADALIQQAEFDNNRHYGVDAADSRVAINASQFNTASVNSLIRVTGSSDMFISSCRLDRAAKHGVEWLSSTGSLVVRDSVIAGAAGHAITVAESEPGKSGALVLQGNILARNGKSGLNLENFTSAVLRDNTFSGNDDYAISYRNEQDAPESELLLQNNRFVQSAQPALRTQNVARLALLNNQFSLGPVNQKLVAGDLEPYQSRIAQEIFKYRCYTEVVRSVSGSGLTVLSDRTGDSQQCAHPTS
ncbi:right-handed parallel beta-helix repeat-containing protein [Gilvimarinus agarilyticus]|uniref:right-handed parallel beta-helix repeat-containing protein n=1 Tax=Gilvimarinus agarilyticus TaxID=679259 RepID=UPI0005A2F483|nr:right-handed parallel beta-helix repeat-containing protein [Gilvimarinus agarilyticus]